MQLNEKQIDSLTEVLNISFARSANALAELTGYRVILTPPQVKMLLLDDVQDELARSIQGDISTVHQIFRGNISGNAMLVLDRHTSFVLTELLSGFPVDPKYPGGTYREVVTEVGNIMLNACLGMFGNILESKISFSVPSLHLDSLEAVLKSISIDHKELQYIVFVSMNFKVKDSEMSGYLLFVMGITSMEVFLEKLDKLS